MKKELVKTVSLRHVDVSVKLDKKAYAPGETAFVKIVPLYNFWQRFLKTHICREVYRWVLIFRDVLFHLVMIPLM